MALAKEGAFAETLLRVPPVRIISRSDADDRDLVGFRLKRDTLIATLHGPSLARLGTTAELFTGPYPISQRWSRALWEHWDQIDGLEYPCRHDDSQMSIALYDRAGDLLDETFRESLRADRHWFGSVLDRYDLGFVA